MNDIRPQGLSVVIPVKGRVGLLRDLLVSLRTARAGCGEPTEVLVVDDSTAGDADAHRRSCAELDACYLRGPRRVGSKRNLGARAARYDQLVFVDSDCRVTDAYLARIGKVLRDSPPEVGGVAGPVRMVGEETAVLRLFRRTQELNQPFSWPDRYAQITWSACANLAVRAEAFHAIEGFAEDTLTVVGGEDVDLGIRLTKSGRPILCDPDSVVLHSRATGDSVGSIGRRLFTYGRSATWLDREHPERRNFRLNPISVVASAAAVALATAGPTRGRSLAAVPVVLAAVVAAHARHRLRPGDGPAALPEVLASTLLDWSFDLGEFVGAWQLRRPRYLFSRFGFMDGDTFRAQPDGEGARR
ncbi:glycosyltransferase [Actinosynnema sp. NPDC050436]|uniref:glycosyltransferase family 2 protein n=1 Tax=Actinosynnema sp. NPDC050436 TaxID=3155659 RepID=UPI00340486BA